MSTSKRVVSADSLEEDFLLDDDYVSGEEEVAVVEDKRPTKKVKRTVDEAVVEPVEEQAAALGKKEKLGKVGKVKKAAAVAVEVVTAVPVKELIRA